MESELVLKNLNNNVDIQSEVKEIDNKTIVVGSKMTDDNISEFEKGLVLACINKSKFADEVSENAAAKFNAEHFKSKKAAIFRAVMPTTLSVQQITPEMIADQDFISTIFNGSLVEVVPDSEQPRPNKNSCRFFVACATWLKLTVNAEISELKPNDLDALKAASGSKKSYVRGFVMEPNDKGANKNDIVQKLKEILLFHEDGTLDLIIVAALNKLMKLMTAEIFISKFLCAAWGKLMKQICIPIASPIMGQLQLCKIKSEADQNAIKEQSQTKNLATGISGFITLHNSQCMQFIEGKKEEVVKLKNKIIADPRQTEFIKIISGNLSQRVQPKGWVIKTSKDEAEFQSHQTEIYETLIELMESREIN